MYLFIDEAGNIKQNKEFTDRDKQSIVDGYLQVIRVNIQYFEYLGEFDKWIKKDLATIKNDSLTRIDIKYFEYISETNRWAPV